MQHAATRMAIMLQALQERIKGLHPKVDVEVLDVLLKGAQAYMGGDETEDNDEDENENEVLQDEPREMGLTLKDVNTDTLQHLAMPGCCLNWKHAM